MNALYFLTKQFQEYLLIIMITTKNIFNYFYYSPQKILN